MSRRLKKPSGEMHSLMVTVTTPLVISVMTTSSVVWVVKKVLKLSVSESWRFFELFLSSACSSSVRSDILFFLKLLIIFFSSLSESKSVLASWTCLCELWSLSLEILTRIFRNALFLLEQLEDAEEDTFLRLWDLLIELIDDSDESEFVDETRFILFVSGLESNLMGRSPSATRFATLISLCVSFCSFACVSSTHLSFSTPVLLNCFFLFFNLFYNFNNKIFLTKRQFFIYASK